MSVRILVSADGMSRLLIQTDDGTSGRIGFLRFALIRVRNWMSKVTRRKAVLLIFVFPADLSDAGSGRRCPGLRAWKGSGSCPRRQENDMRR